MSAGTGNKYASFNNTQKILEWKNRRDWVKDELSRFRAKRTIALFNSFRVKNQKNDLTKEQWIKLSEVYRPESNLPEVTVRQFLNNIQVKEYSDTQLMKYYEELNINMPYLVKQKKDLYEIALRKEDVKNGLNVIHSIQEDMGMKNKIKVSETRQTNSNLVDNFNKAKQTITVTSEKQGQINQNTSSINDDNEEKTRENTLPDAENEQKTENEE